MSDIIGWDPTPDNVTEELIINNNSTQVAKTETASPMVLIVAVIVGLVLLISLIPALILMYRKNKIQKRINREMVSDVYDDNRLDDYEEYDKIDENEYDVPHDVYDNEISVDSDDKQRYE